MLEITVPARLDRLDTVLEFADGIIRGTGMDVKRQNDLFVAVEEIFANIASYAYPADTGDVTVRISVFPDKLSLEFIDGGKPYNPLAKPDPDLSFPAAEREIGGLGVYMTKKMMDSVKYRYEDNKNILIMEIFLAEKI